MEEKNGRYIVTVYVGLLSEDYEALSVEASKHTTAEEIVSCIVQKLGFPNAHEFELAEVIGNSVGQECKERRISSYESPVALKLLWPKVSEPTSDNKLLNKSISSVDSHSPNASDCYRFCLREKLTDSLWNKSFVKDTQFIRDYFYRFHFQPKDKEYPDLCQLPDLNEQTLLESLKSRFNAGHIYSYVGSILIAVNPFKFYPIYNPKYVKLYQNRRREELPPHIFAIADVAYHTMLKEKRNQCIVISGESASGKTESTNFLLHHLTALTQKGTHGSGVEQTILSAGPVLEAFGNAKTAHNNNSSRFGKFIQVSYRENGTVHGSIVQKFLLEKSRICCQAQNERNYHVFYYLLAGANDTDKELLKLLPAHNYHYLNQSGCYTLEAVDESYEFSRLKQSMEMVGFGVDKQRMLFSVLSAVLLLGNVKFVPKKSSYHDESVFVKNPDVVRQISSLLRVAQETLLASLTSKRARVSGEMLVINYRMAEAIAARDAMAKCLYGALFDWIVLQLNHALLSRKWYAGKSDFRGKSIGVLDIFGFEDFQNCNSFEQYCINYANEHLQHYFNQHVFKYEQEEYKKEGIKWTNIDFLDNSPCLSLIEAKPNGLICILDDQCNFPGATNETLLQKFNSVHKEHKFYEVPQKREEAFVICHYAGKVKYQIAEFREKNMDHMRQSFIQSFKNSSSAFVRELVGNDPVAVFRWAILRAFFRAVFAFRHSGKVAAANRRHRSGKENSTFNRGPGHQRSSMTSDQLVKKSRSFRLPQNTRGMKNLRSVKMLASNLAAIGVSHKNSRKQPISVSQQFQQSLHSLMVTLNQANPFFIRCIKSNSDKIANAFDDTIVQRQLRYTGMLETVRIRQAGYNVRLNYDEFIHLYRILLPKGLKSERQDVESFLSSLHLNTSNYQLGEHKVFLRETEKIKLDYFLHQQILASIVCIQRWYRAILERRHFLRVQEAIVTLQSYVRMFLAQRHVANLRMMHLAATYIQKMWRGHRVRKWYQNLRKNCTQFQARIRGNILRERFQTIVDNHRRMSKEKNIMNSFVEEQHNPALPKPVNDVQHFTGLTKDNYEDDSAIIQKPKSKHIPESYEVLPPFMRSPAIHERKQKRAPKTPVSIPDNHYDFLAEVADDNSKIYDPSASLKKDNKNASKTPTKNAFHRAKKHIKTIMISGNASKSKLEKHEATVLESGSEGEDNESSFQITKISTLPSTSKINSLKNSQSSETIASLSTSTSKQSDLQLRHTKSLKTVVDTSMLKQPEEATVNNLINTKVYLNDRDSSKSKAPSELRLKENNELDNTYKYSGPVKPGVDRTGGDRKYQIYEDSLSKNGFETSVSYSHYVRRESDGVVSLSSGDARRPSRDSAQSCSVESPSMSSQDSIFYYGGAGSSKNGPSETRRYEKSTTSGVPAHTPLFGTTSYNNRRPSKTNASVGGLLSFDVNSGREVRRSRSVSESRGSSGSLNDSNRVDFILSDSTSDMNPEAADGMGNLKKFGFHALDKVSKFHRGDSCSACKKSMHAALSPGRKCFECKCYFHEKCIDNGAILNHPCDHPNKNAFGKPRNKSETIGRRLRRKQSKVLVDTSTKQNFSLTGTSEFTDAAEQIISDVRELQLMQEFISEKIFQVSNKEGEKSSLADKVFQQALREFKESLVSSFSVASKQGGIMQLSITYKDLISYFANIMETVCMQQGIGSDDFPAIMGVNALRGFLNEFMNCNRLEEKPKFTKGRKKIKRNKRQKVDETINYLGHSFVTMVVYIPTACEICSSFIMWPIERGVVCQVCKLACHKKCHCKLQVECSDSRGNNNCDAFGVFGAPLASLIPENGTIPPIIDKLVSVIEFYGLRQEGLYRKSGVTSKVKELKNDIKEGKTIAWDAHPVHVYTSVLKSFFHELPEPLLTFELYDEFLRAADMSRVDERIETIFSLLQKLPKPNYDLTERLVFHLVRVAMYESNNRMNASSLAIVFAPCILRTNKTRQVQESLGDVSRQTLCVQTIIEQQLKRFKCTLSNIESVDSATRSFSGRLNSIRTKQPSERLKTYSGSNPSMQSQSTEVSNMPPVPDNMSAEEEEEYLKRHIEHLKNEKAMLTTLLPSLSVARTSDDEMLSTDPEVESSAGSVDDLHRDSLSSPSQARTATCQQKSSDCSGLTTCQECLSTSQSRQPDTSLLPHNVIKHKNRGPIRKAPSRFVRNQFSVVNFGEDEEDMYDLNSDLEDLKDLSNDEDDEGAIMV